MQVIDTTNNNRKRRGGGSNASGTSEASNTDSHHNGTFFKIPARSMALCDEPSNENQFYVKDRINVTNFSESELNEYLSQAMEKISGAPKKAIYMLTNDVFDPFYSILFHLDQVSLTIRKDLIQSLNMGLKNLS